MSRKTTTFRGSSPMWPLLLLLFLSPRLLPAQLVLTNRDVPQAGDSLVTYFIADSLLATVSVGDSTPGQSWNFNLPKWGSGFSSSAYAYTTPVGSLFDSTFPSATLVRVEDDGFPDGGVSATSTYTHTGSDGTDDIGVGSIYRVRAGEREYLFIKQIEGLGRPLPMTYGTTWDRMGTVRALQTPTDTSLPQTPRLVLRAITHSTGRVDAWGTVVTPHGAWPALRVHALDLTADTIINDAGEPDGIYYDTLETYDWYITELGTTLPVVSMEIYQGKIASVRMARPIINHPTIGVDRDDEIGARGGALDLSDLSIEGEGMRNGGDYKKRKGPPREAAPTGVNYGYEYAQQSYDSLLWHRNAR